MAFVRYTKKNKEESDKPFFLKTDKCPISKGYECSMTIESFNRMCASRKNVEIPACGKCTGIPDEIIIKDGDKMAEWKSGKCEICHKEKNIKMVKGKKCCSVCGIIYGYADISPELLVNCIMSFHGTKYFPVATSEEHERLQKTLDETIDTKNSLVEELATIKALLDVLTKENIAMKEQMAISPILNEVDNQKDKDEMTAKLNELEQALSDREQQLEEATRKMNEYKDLANNIAKTLHDEYTIKNDMNAHRIFELETKLENLSNENLNVFSDTDIVEAKKILDSCLLDLILAGLRKEAVDPALIDRMRSILPMRSNDIIDNDRRL